MTIITDIDIGSVYKYYMRKRGIDGGSINYRLTTCVSEEELFDGEFQIAIEDQHLKELVMKGYNGVYEHPKDKITWKPASPGYLLKVFEFEDPSDKIIIVEQRYEEESFMIMKIMKE